MLLDITPFRGCLVHCFYPEHHNPNVPGSKRRPVMVLRYDQQTHRALVLYCTSQNVDVARLGELVVKQGDMDGLSKTTKVCLGHYRWVPVTSEYFSNEIAVIGRLPKNYHFAFMQAFSEVRDALKDELKIGI